jgi:two-component system, sensor histidine kinase and response regulator
MKGTVLVVDDTPANVKVLVACLSAAEFHVLVAEDGPGALEQLRHVKPDLILLDVMMPNLDGFETCRRMKADPATRDIPVIFMTAAADTDNKLKGFEVGAVDYITKPYHQGEVLSRVTTQVTLCRQRRELEAVLEQRATFMRIAAHDLRNPLTGVLTWTDLALDEVKTLAGGAMLTRMLNHILGAAQRTQAIIEDFLALQVLQSKPRAATAAPFDLGRVLTQVLSEQGFAAEKKGMALRREDEPDLPATVGDAARTHQVLSNLVSNAIKYSPPRTEVRLSIRRAQGRLRVEVQDQGPGVRAENRSKLFVEFARIGNKPTGDETSTGLGLAIVKLLAESQGGRVGADFPESGGSIFWCELPAVAGHPAA